MPKLIDKDPMQTHQTLHSFNFSAVEVSNLGASDYTLVTIVQDTSTSVTDFKGEMEKTLKQILEACQKSQRSENLLLRLVEFNSKVDELHGFRELRTIDAKEYDDVLDCHGMTCCRDAILDSTEATEVYAEQLVNMDYAVNAILFIITDGDDNASVVATNPDIIKEAFGKIRKKEHLESFTTVLIGVSDEPSVKAYLQDLNDNAGIDQYVDMGDATPAKLAKLADFISRSISSTSKSLGSGAASQPLTF